MKLLNLWAMALLLLISAAARAIREVEGEDSLVMKHHVIRVFTK
jgi:hypothetical protein